MDSIPLEVKSLIVDNLEDKEDFLTCRLVCKSLKAIATPKAFRLIVLIPKEDIFDIIQNLLARPDLSCHVKEIIYHDSIDRKFDNVEVMSATTACFLHLSKFENLVELYIQFPFTRDIANTLRGHEPSCIRHLQTAIFEALATRTPPKKLRNLHVVAVLASPYNSFHLPGLAEFLKPIKELNLLVFSEDRPEDRTIYRTKSFQQFWKKDFPVFLKSPMSLTKLVIYTDRDHLFPDKKTLDSLFYPNLTSLEFHGVRFEGPPESGAEGFIVRHAASLKKLHLSHCVVVPHYGQPNSTIAAQILDHLKEKLINLRQFTIVPARSQI